MVQARLVKAPAQDVVWGEAKVRARVEAEWADRLQQGRAEIVSAQAAVRQSLMLRDSLAIKKAVRNVEQK